MEFLTPSWVTGVTSSRWRLSFLIETRGCLRVMRHTHMCPRVMLLPFNLRICWIRLMTFIRRIHLLILPLGLIDILKVWRRWLLRRWGELAQRKVQAGKPKWKTGKKWNNLANRMTTSIRWWLKSRKTDTLKVPVSKVLSKSVEKAYIFRIKVPPSYHQEPTAIKKSLRKK